MCCRYHLTARHYRALLERLGIPAPAAYVERYNIAPGGDIAAFRTGRAGAEAVPLRWGLTPAWARDDEPESRLVNARAETLAEKPSFRDAVRLRRCVIPASGFFEWEAKGKNRQPWLFRWRDEQPLGLAGVWESWRAPDGETVASCAVITTAPNELMRPIHHRMPAMLTADQCAQWLDPRLPDPARFAPLQGPPPAGTMTAQRVHPRMSNARYDAPDCLEIVAESKAEEDPQFSLGI